jgi:hypothetical protein
MPNVAEILQQHTSLNLRCVDRLYLNGYVPLLQQPGGVIRFLREARECRIPSPAVFGQMTQDFKERLRGWAERQEIPWIEFRKGERKDELVQRYRDRFDGAHGVVLIGVAQERASSWQGRRERRGRWVHFNYQRRSVCVNHYYVYVVDREWGPAFIKFCGYAPFAIKLCLNGHEWAKRQATRRRLRFEALDNGFLWCASPDKMQKLCDSLGPRDIEEFFARWRAVLPWPLTAEDEQSGFAHRLSILQMEVSLTQVFDRPVRGREFFEEVLRDHLDLGRPDRMQLLFERRITRRTPGRFRTRIITHGVAPSLHLEYKRCDIKQYFKEGRALRTETTFNNTLDFGVGRGLQNFDYLRTLGQHINGRLLEIERVAHDCSLSEAQLAELVLPGKTEEGQPAPALKYGDPRAMSLLAALCLFALVPEGITNRSLRPLVAQLLGRAGPQYTARQMGYDLRRLWRKGLIQKLDGRNVYVLTVKGRRIALFLTKLHSRAIRPGLQILDDRIQSHAPPPLRQHFTAIDLEVQRQLREARLCA